MAIPRSSAEYYQRQQRILAALLLAVRQVWRRMSPEGRWQEQYERDGVGAQLLLLVSAAQVAAARDADLYIATVLQELGLASQVTPGVVAPAGFAGVAGDGRELETLLGLAVPRAGRLFVARREVSVTADPVERPEWVSDVLWESLERERLDRFTADVARDTDRVAAEVLRETGRWMEMVTATAVIDAARAAESSASVARPEVTGYVRMLNPPSCSRCTVLAGRFYKWNDGFERHNLCDCRHIPSTESMAGDMTVDPDAYFHSLPTAAELAEQYPEMTIKMRRGAGLVSQEDIFTNAGAQAIRDGADISQVVNARRSMEKAQFFGRDVLMTRESITRFGQYGRSRGGFEKQRNRRYQASRHVRLMPESLYEAAESREDAIRLLRLHGFII